MCALRFILLSLTRSDGNVYMYLCWLIWESGRELLLEVVLFSFEVIGKAGNLCTCLYLSWLSLVEFPACGKEKFINRSFLL